METTELPQFLAGLSHAPLALVALEGGSASPVITYGNGAFLRLLHPPEGNVTGRPILDLLLPGVSHEARETAAAQLFGPEIVRETVIEGRPRPLKVTVHPLAEAEGPVGRWLMVFSSPELEQIVEGPPGSTDAFYKIALEAGSDWTWATDSDHRIIYLSDDFRDLTGLDPEYALGHTRGEIADPLMDRASLALHREMLDRHEGFRDFTYSSATGGQGLRYFRISGKPVLDQDGSFKGYFGTGTDVTEAEQARLAAQTFEARVSDAIEQIESGFALFDTDNRLVLANGRFRSLFEKMEHRLVRGNLFRTGTREGTHTLKAGADFELLVEQALTGDHSPHIEEHQLAEGTWLRCGRTRLTDGGLALVLTDISERKKAEEAAARAEARLMDAIENLAGAFVLWDAEDRVNLFNSRGKDLYGKGGDFMVKGRTFEEVLHHAVESGAINVPGGKREHWIAERIRHHKDASEVMTRRYPDGRWVRITEHKTREGGVVGIGVDITELKLREQQLEKARHEAELANSAKTRFLAAASHDLRQPLHAMGLFLSSLKKKVKGNGEAEKLVENVETSLDAMNELFGALLDISRLEAATVEPRLTVFPLSMLLKRMETRFALPARDKGLELTVLPCTLFTRSDSNMLERIVSNFIANAVRYTDAGRILVGCRHRGHDISIEIRDTGPGIPKNQMRNIFKEFHQVNNPERDRKQGLGLGLAIADRLAKLLHHKISVESRPDRGSTFSILVPMMEPPTKEALPKPRAVFGGLSGRRVMVIDDDAEVLAGMEAVLGDLGCEALAFGSAEEAVAAMVEGERAPDLIIADYRLRDSETGAGAIAKVRSHLGVEVPGIIVTGDTAPERLKEARASGFQLLHKPVRPANMAAVMRYQLRTKDQPNQD